MTVRVLTGDCVAVLAGLPDASAQTCVTSPPYFGLRDYGVAGQIGLEPTPSEYVERLVAVFREVRRVLRDDGTLWLNLGDSYANDGKWGGSTGGKHVAALHDTPVGRLRRSTGLKPKDLLGIPWRVAFALQADGWYLRSDIIWSKPNPMPESVTDRPTKAHEYLFLLSKSERYAYDADAVREPYAEATVERLAQATFDRQQGGPKDPKSGNRSCRRALVNLKGRVMSPQIEDDPGAFRAGGRNRRSVWTVATQPYSGAHFATFPPALIEPCILAGCPKGGTVLDPFGGAGTTGLVADRLGRDAVLIELNPTYAAMARERIAADAPLFADGAA